MSPTSDTKSKVVTTFLDKPTFSCSRCTAVIVRELRDAEVYYWDVHTDEYMDDSAGPSGRANQQGVLGQGRARIVSTAFGLLSSALSPRTYQSHLTRSLIHSVVNLKMGKKEDRPLM